MTTHIEKLCKNCFFSIKFEGIGCNYFKIRRTTKSTSEKCNRFLPNRYYDLLPDGWWNQNAYTLTINCEAISPMHRQKIVDTITGHLNKEAQAIAEDLHNFPKEAQSSAAYKEMKGWQEELKKQSHSIRSKYNEWVYKR